MQTAPANKLWPRAEPAHQAYERACKAATEAECRCRADAPDVLAAREAVRAADVAYRAACLADEKERFINSAGPFRCPCGATLDLKEHKRCPDCHRRLPARPLK